MPYYYLDSGDNLNTCTADCSSHGGKVSGSSCVSSCPNYFVGTECKDSCDNYYPSSTNNACEDSCSYYFESGGKTYCVDCTGASQFVNLPTIEGDKTMCVN